MQTTAFNAFRTTGTATYGVSPVDAALAEYVGCPEATHRLEGHTGTVYGYFVATGREPGKPVRVPDWTSRKGVRVLFVPAGPLDETVSWGSVVDGYLGE